MNIEKSQHETQNDLPTKNEAQEGIVVVAGVNFTFDEREVNLLEGLTDWEKRSERSTIILGKPIFS